MIAASFDESNLVLNSPPDMNCDECQPLSVFRGFNKSQTPVVISCWKITKEELEEIQRTGRVWLTVIGETMPPALVSGISPWNTES